MNLPRPVDTIPEDEQDAIFPSIPPQRPLVYHEVYQGIPEADRKMHPSNEIKHLGP